MELEIADNLARVRGRIADAARRSGRAADEITLVVVSKTVAAAVVSSAYEAGETDFGESYVQEALAKRQDPRISQADIRWHFIGHLQSNKVPQVAGQFTLVHSIDRLTLARELGRCAQKTGSPTSILIQVKLDSADTKFGLAPEETPGVVEAVLGIEGLELAGLMGMAPFSDEPETSRPHFRILRRLFDELPPENRRVLSMGMTRDFEVAVEEGATLVRVGTAIFGARTRT